MPDTDSWPFMGAGLLAAILLVVVGVVVVRRVKLVIPTHTSFEPSGGAELLAKLHIGLQRLSYWNTILGWLSVLGGFGCSMLASTLGAEARGPLVATAGIMMAALGWALIARAKAAEDAHVFISENDNDNTPQARYVLARQALAIWMRGRTGRDQLLALLQESDRANLRSDQEEP